MANGERLAGKCCVERVVVAGEALTGQQCAN